MTRLLLTAISFMALTVHAQNTHGFKAGLNLSTAGGTGATDLSTKAGFHFGMFTKHDITKTIAIQSELLYSGQGAKSISSTYALAYVNMPVLLQYTDPSGLFAQAGPQVGYLLSARSKAGSSSQSISNQFKSFDFSLALGAGYSINKHIGCNIRYLLGLSKTVKNGDRTYNRVFQASLFYTFSSIKEMLERKDNR